MKYLLKGTYARGSTVNEVGFRYLYLADSSRASCLVVGGFPPWGRLLCGAHMHVAYTRQVVAYVLPSFVGLCEMFICKSPTCAYIGTCAYLVALNSMFTCSWIFISAVLFPIPPYKARTRLHII